MKRFSLFACLLGMLFLMGCSGPLDKALAELDDLKKIIGNRTGDLSTELEKWRKDLPKDVQSLIDNDIKQLSRDIVGSTASETRCTIDFLRNRFIQSVENIKLKLLHQPIVYQRPCFCSLSLPQINPNNDPKSIESINFYGYDFNNPDSKKNLMKAFLVGDSGELEIENKFIGRSTSYQVAMNIADILPDIASNRYNKIKWYWNGDSTLLSEVVISKWNPENKFVPIQPRAFSWYAPHTGGDDDFDTDYGNPASGRVGLQTRVNNNILEGRLFYDVMESGGDNTRVGVNLQGEASAWGPWNAIYTNSDSNYELIGNSPAAPNIYPFTVVDHGPKRFDQGGSIVEKFVAYVDEKGPDVANAHVDVIFNPIQIILKRKRPVRPQ